MALRRGLQLGGYKAEAPPSVHPPEQTVLSREDSTEDQVRGTGTGARDNDDPYEPDDNCILRIHIPFPGAHVVDPKKQGIGCQDVVVYE